MITRTFRSFVALFAVSAAILVTGCTRGAPSDSRTGARSSSRAVTSFGPPDSINGSGVKVEYELVARDDFDTPTTGDRRTPGMGKWCLPYEGPVSGSKDDRARRLARNIRVDATAGVMRLVGDGLTGAGMCLFPGLKPDGAVSARIRIKTPQGLAAAVGYNVAIIGWPTDVEGIADPWKAFGEADLMEAHVNSAGDRIVGEAFMHDGPNSFSQYKGDAWRSVQFDGDGWIDVSLVALKGKMYFFVNGQLFWQVKPEHFFKNPEGWHLAIQVDPGIGGVPDEKTADGTPNIVLEVDQVGVWKITNAAQFQAMINSADSASTTERSQLSCR